MEIEVMVPVHASDFNFDSTPTSPYITAPSTPIRHGNFFYSAPASPSRSSPLNVSQDFYGISSSPFDLGENSGTTRNRSSDFSEDFEFDFSGQLESFDFSAADELFHGGKIRPLKPVPGYDDQAFRVSSPKSPNSRVSMENDFGQIEKKFSEETRGRERSTGSSSGYVHKGSRSQSPLRVSDITLEHEDDSPSSDFVASSASNQKPSISSSFLSALSFSGRSNKKWKLKDLLLFRSASEGRATATSTKESLKLFNVSPRRESEKGKTQSFRDGESVGSSSVIGSGSRRRGSVPVPVSALEYYTTKRAVSEQLKRKTVGTYRRGWLDRFVFPRAKNVPVYGSLPRGRS